MISHRLIRKKKRTKVQTLNPPMTPVMPPPIMIPPLIMIPPRTLSLLPILCEWRSLDQTAKGETTVSSVSLSVERGLPMQWTPTQPHWFQTTIEKSDQPLEYVIRSQRHVIEHYSSWICKSPVAESETDRCNTLNQWAPQSPSIVSSIFTSSRLCQQRRTPSVTFSKWIESLPSTEVIIRFVRILLEFMWFHRADFHHEDAHANNIMCWTLPETITLHINQQSVTTSILPVWVDYEDVNFDVDSNQFDPGCFHFMEALRHSHLPVITN